MQIKLEFAEKLVDIKPSIQLLTLGVEGKGRQRRGGETLLTPSYTLVIIITQSYWSAIHSGTFAMLL